MFFVLAKSFWFVAQPLNFAIVMLAAGLVAWALGWRGVAAGTIAASFLVLFLGGWTTLGALLMSPLEERFARPGVPPERVDGIVVLGGGLEGAINLARGGYELNRGGDRLVEAAALALRYPEAKVLVSGGTGTLVLDGEGDGETAPRLLRALGVAPERLLMDTKSRDTYENALFSKELAAPQPGQTWLLVTSAFHMPRSVALFRKVDFPVVPWPTDYRTSGHEGVGLLRDGSLDALHNATTGLREWIGLIVYRLTGRTDELLPSPE